MRITMLLCHLVFVLSALFIAGQCFPELKETTELVKGITDVKDPSHLSTSLTVHRRKKRFIGALIGLIGIGVTVASIGQTASQSTTDSRDYKRIENELKKQQQKLDGMERRLQNQGENIEALRRDVENQRRRVEELHRQLAAQLTKIQSTLEAQAIKLRNIGQRLETVENKLNEFEAKLNEISTGVIFNGVRDELKVLKNAALRLKFITYVGGDFGPRRLFYGQVDDQIASYNDALDNFHRQMTKGDPLFDQKSLIRWYYEKTGSARKTVEFRDAMIAHQAAAYEYLKILLVAKCQQEVDDDEEAPNCYIQQMDMLNDVTEYGKENIEKQLYSGFVSMNNVKFNREVFRGPDWDRGNEDGGVRSIGFIIRDHEDGWVTVRWVGNGKQHDYRVGAEGRFDLLYPGGGRRCTRAHPCAVTGLMSEWSDWSPYSKRCGIAVRVRHRHCTSEDETRTCSENPIQTQRHHRGDC